MFASVNAVQTTFFGGDTPLVSQMLAVVLVTLCMLFAVENAGRALFAKYRSLKLVRQKCVAFWVVRFFVCELVVFSTFGQGFYELFTEGRIARRTLDGTWWGFHMTLACYVTEVLYRPRESGLQSSFSHHAAMLLWGAYLAANPSLALLKHSVLMSFMGIGVCPAPCNVAFFIYYFRTPTAANLLVMKAMWALLMCARIVQWVGWAAVVVPSFASFPMQERIVVGSTAVVFFYVEFSLPMTLARMIATYESKVQKIAHGVPEALLPEPETPQVAAESRAMRSWRVVRMLVRRGSFSRRGACRADDSCRRNLFALNESQVAVGSSPQRTQRMCQLRSVGQPRPGFGSIGLDALG